MVREATKKDRQESSKSSITYSPTGQKHFKYEQYIGISTTKKNNFVSLEFVFMYVNVKHKFWCESSVKKIYISKKYL